MGAGKERAKFWAVRRRGGPVEGWSEERSMGGAVLGRSGGRATFWVSQRRGVQRRVWGLGFRVQVCGDKNEQNKRKVKSKMRKKKKKKEEKKRKRKKRKRKRKRRNRANTIICSTSANFDFGQFRLRPAGRIVRSRIGRSRASSSPSSPRQDASEREFSPTWTMCT